MLHNTVTRTALLLPLTHVLLDAAGSDSIMKAITEKMCELARKKEEQQQQQARDSDTLSTIIIPPTVINTQHDLPVSRAPRRTADRALRRVETDVTAAERAAGRPQVDHPASDGEDSDAGRETVSGRPGPLRRWPQPSDGGQGSDGDSDVSDEDSSDNNNSKHVSVHPRGSSSYQQQSMASTSTVTPDDSRTDSSTLVCRATVI